MLGRADARDRRGLPAQHAAVALNIKADVVYRWIDSGLFEYVDLSSGPTGKPNYRIRRASFLEFLKNRVNRI